MKDQAPANGVTLFQGPMYTPLGNADVVSAGGSQKPQVMRCQRAKETNYFNRSSYSFGTMTNAEHQEEGWNISEEEKKRSWGMIQKGKAWENLSELTNKCNAGENVKLV